MTVSSKPTISTGPTRAGSSTRAVPWRTTAAHTVDHATPKLRATDAGVPSSAATRFVAHSAALVVSTRRGSASSAVSVQVLVAQSTSGQDQIRLRHRTSTARSPTGASRTVTHRRSLARARDPHLRQPTTVAVVWTSTTSSASLTATSSTSKPAAPNHSAPLPSPTRGLPSLGPSSSHEIRGGPHLTGGPSPHPWSQVHRAGPVTEGLVGRLRRPADAFEVSPARPAALLEQVQQ